MTSTLQLFNELTRLDSSNQQSTGSLPASRTIVLTTSEVKQVATQLVNTTHEVLLKGDCTDDCMAILVNKHATAVVEVGVVVSSVFYPLFDIPPGEKAQLPRVSALASTYVKSTVLNSELDVILHKIVAPV